MGVPNREAALAMLAAEGCSAPRFWGNAAGDTYGTHSHDYHKALVCEASR